MTCNLEWREYHIKKKDITIAGTIKINGKLQPVDMHPLVVSPNSCCKMNNFIIIMFTNEEVTAESY
jgi:hypothetical protein